MNWVTNTRILADYKACHATYKLKIVSINLQLAGDSFTNLEAGRLIKKLPGSESGSGIGLPATNFWRKF